MQDEINQRLSDINRISEQTDFNGVKVLSANAKPLTLQVGANDGETITLNLSEISVKTLERLQRERQGRDGQPHRHRYRRDRPRRRSGRQQHKVTTQFANATAEQVFGKLETATWSPSARAQAPPPTPTTLPPARSRTQERQHRHEPLRHHVEDQARQRATGTYELTAGNKATFEVDAAGKITVGQAAFLTTAGELTTNNGSGAARGHHRQPADLRRGQRRHATLTIGGTTWPARWQSRLQDHRLEVGRPDRPERFGHPQHDHAGLRHHVGHGEHQRNLDQVQQHLRRQQGAS